MVQTEKDGTANSYSDGVAGGGRRGGEGAVRGPLKNFRAGSSSGGSRKKSGRRRVGGIREKGGDDRDSESYGSGERTSSADDDDDGSSGSRVRHVFDVEAVGQYIRTSAGVA